MNNRFEAVASCGEVIASLAMISTAQTPQHTDHTTVVKTHLIFHIQRDLLNLGVEL